MKKILFLSTTLFISLSTFAQKDKFISSKDKKGAAQADSNSRVKTVSKTIYLGPGFGLDYAGLGIKLEAYPSNSISAFVSVGTNFYGIGFNTGLSLKLLPESRVTPTLQGMYGYNGVLVIKNAYNNSVQSTKNYNGFSAGAGVDFTMGSNLNKAAIVIWIPFRSPEFQRDIKATNATVLPVAFSLGLKFAFL